MKIKVLVCILAVMTLLTGCSYSQTGIDSLFSPPKLSNQQNEIYTALETSVGNNIKLKYPRKGDFTSAFLINNIDAEPTQEAIVFYENPANTQATMPLRINLLDQQDGKWVSKFEVGVAANEVEKVSFVSKNHQIYIIIGYNLLSKSEKLVVMYIYNEGVLDEVFSTSCVDYEIADIDDNRSSELIAFVEKKGEREAKTTEANVYSINGGLTNVVSHTPMDPNVTDYINIQKGKLADGRSALYIDGLKGTNKVSTQILTYENGRVDNLIYNKNDKENIIDSTIRSYGSLSMDLNADGVFEIPSVKPALGYENLPQHEQLYLTNWFNYIDGKLVMQNSTYVAYSLGYIFTLPPEWADTVSLQYVANDNELIFYDYKRRDEYDSKLLSIKVVKRAQYDKDVQNDSYTLLRDNGQLLYTYRLYETTSDIRILEEQVLECFNLL